MKNNCTYVQLWPIMNMIQKDQNPRAASEAWGAKAGYCAGPLHTPPPEVGGQTA